MTPNTLAQLGASLQQLIDADGQFDISDEVLGTANVDQLLQASPIGATLVFTSREQVQVAADSVTVSGTVSFLNANMTATLLVTQPGGTRMVLLTATPDSKWALATSFPGVGSTAIAAFQLTTPAFLFTTAAQPESPGIGALDAGLNLSGQSNVADHWPDAVTFFSASGSVTLRGPVSTSAAGAGFRVQAPAGNGIELTPLSFPDSFVGAQLQWSAGQDSNNNAKTASGAYLIGITKAVSGLPYPISLSAASTGSNLYEFVLDLGGGISLDQIGALLDAAGGGNSASWQSLLPSQIHDALQALALYDANVTVVTGPRGLTLSSVSVTAGITMNWTLQPPFATSSTPLIEFDSVIATWNWSNPPQNGGTYEIDIEAEMNVVGHEFDVTITTEPVITGQLQSDDPISVTQLLSDLFGGHGSPPDEVANVNVTGLTVTVDVPNDTFSISATATADFNLFGEAELVLSEGDLAFVYDGSAKTIDIGVSATFMIGTSLSFTFAANIGSADKSFSASFKANPSSPPTFVGFLNALPGVSVTLPQNVPDLELNALSLSGDWSGNSSVITIAGDVAAVWPVPIGASDAHGNQMQAVDVKFVVNSTKSSGARTYSGSILGSIDFGQTITLGYQFGNNVRLITGHWQALAGETIGWNDIAKGLHLPTELDLPSSMPSLGLSAIDITIDLSREIFTADVHTSFGYVVIRVAKDTSGNWGFIFGVAFPANWTIGDATHGLGSDFAKLDFVKFKQAAFLISTQDNATFSDPSFPNLGGQKLIKGLTFAAAVDFNDAGNTGGLAGTLGTFAKAAMSPELTITGGIGADISKSFIQATLTNLTVPQIPITLQSAFVKLQPDPANFLVMVGGDLLVPVNNAVLDFSGFFALEAEGFTFAGNAKLPKQNDPVSVPGFALYDIGVEAGVDAEGPFLGLEAELGIGTGTPSDDKFAFVFSIVGEVPDVQFFRASFDELDLDQMFEVLVPNVKLPSDLENILIIRNFLIFFCTAPTVLPDKTSYQPGYAFSGDVSMFDGKFEADASVNISASNMSGHFDMTPETVKTTDGTTIISITGGSSQGGPLIDFSTSPAQGKKYLDVEVDFNFLGITDDIDITLDKNGLTIKTALNVPGLSSDGFSATLVKKGTFSASAHASLDLDVTVGPYTKGGIELVPQVELNGPDASISIAISADPSPSASFTIQLTFDWKSLHFDRTLHLDLKDIENGFKNLVDMIYTWCKQHVDDLFHDFLDTAEHWIAAVKAAFTDFANDVDKLGNALANEFKVGAQEAADYFNQFAFDFDTKVKALLKWFGDEINNSEQEAAKLLGDATKTCAMGTANSSIGTGAAKPMAAGAAPHVPELPDTSDVLFHLSASATGRELVRLYYLNARELRDTLERRPTVRRQLARATTTRGDDGAFTAGASQVLRALASGASPRLQNAVNETIAVLDKHAASDIESFMAELSRDDVGTAKE